MLSLSAYDPTVKSVSLLKQYVLPQ